MRALGFLLAMCALVAAGCGGGGGESAEETFTPSQSSITAVKREQAPPIEGETLGGKRVALADFRGTPVFVNVWSSW